MTLALQLFKNSVGAQEKLRLNLHSLSVSELLEYGRKWNSATRELYRNQNLLLDFPVFSIPRFRFYSISYFFGNLACVLPFTFNRQCLILGSGRYLWRGVEWEVAPKKKRLGKQNFERIKGWVDEKKNNSRVD
jgi:hypothetical protein